MSAFLLNLTLALIIAFLAYCIAHAVSAAMLVAVAQSMMAMGTTGPFAIFIGAFIINLTTLAAAATSGLVMVGVARQAAPRINAFIANARARVFA